MKETWEKLKSILKDDALEVFEYLNPGAKESQIVTLEKQLGVDLPSDYRTFLALCDGQDDDPDFGFYEGFLLSTTNIFEHWKRWQDALEAGEFNGNESTSQPGVQNQWWNPKWIPFTHDGGSNHLCIDLDPAVDGKYGQVIAIGAKDPERTLRFASFTEWLEHVLSGLESGNIVFDYDMYCRLVDATEIA